MNKSIFALAALILAFPAFSDETRINTTRDGGGYEVSLRDAGVPLSGGLAWSTHGTSAGIDLQLAAKAAPVAVAPTKVALTKPAKNG